MNVLEHLKILNPSNGNYYFLTQTLNSQSKIAAVNTDFFTGEADLIKKENSNKILFDFSSYNWITNQLATFNINTLTIGERLYADYISDVDIYNNEKKAYSLAIDSFPSLFGSIDNKYLIKSIYITEGRALTCNNIIVKTINQNISVQANKLVINLPILSIM